MRVVAASLTETSVPQVDSAILPSMPADNVELVRRWLAAMSTSPEEAVARVAELWDADVDYYPVRKFPEARPCHGREEVEHFIDQFSEPYSRSVWEIRELVAVSDDRVLACSNVRAEGYASGLKLEGDVYQCYWIRHGRFFRVEDHLTLKGARQGLGLEG